VVGLLLRAKPEVEITKIKTHKFELEWTCEELKDEIEPNMPVYVLLTKGEGLFAVGKTLSGVRNINTTGYDSAANVIIGSKQKLDEVKSRVRLELRIKKVSLDDLNKNGCGHLIKRQRSVTRLYATDVSNLNQAIK
jgi:hypothetical protein